ncbi:MAG: helix-turn-helix domain-containing protein [Planctomycetes bacterium]|nr:helix-turn-helix domain-containing protein [Planctomycetota bacterium]
MIIGTGMLEQPLGHTFERAPGYPYWTLGCQLAGGTLFESRGRSCTMLGRCINLVRPRTPYHISFAGDERRWNEVWAIFTPRPDWVTLLEWPELIPGVLHLDADAGDAARALEVFIEVHRLASGAHAERMRFAENALERGLLLAHLANPRAGLASLHPGVRAAVALIAERPGDAMSVESLARHARMSPSHLAHLFAGQLGESPMRYLESQRMERAKHLLAATDLAIGRIAGMVGFDNAFHFSTRFRARVGISPRTYRRQPTG